MLAWSPEEPRNRPRQQVEGVPGSMRDDPGRPAAPGGYEYTSNHISGFSLTHLMGTGCAGASGDIPFMPYVGEVTSSPADDLRAEIYGSTYGPKGFVPPGKGSGGWVVLDTSKSANVGVRVGISYVSQANAEANLRAENPTGTTFDTVRKKAHAAWNDALNRIQIEGGTYDEQVVFYTALYHTLMGENLYSDVDGSYMGMDGKVHTVTAPHKAQYSTFSGWDV